MDTPASAPPFSSTSLPRRPRPRATVRGALVALAVLTAAHAPAAAQTLVRDFTPSGIGRSGNPSAAVVAGPLAFFTATDALGLELWRTDGSAAGTFRLVDLAAGRGDSTPRDLCAVGNLLFFTADVPGLGRELYVTDGTTAGTRLVLDIDPRVDVGSDPAHLTAFAGRVFFTANDGATGPELWSSDGTAAGTARVVDLMPGANHAGPRDLAVWNNELWFAAQDGRGFEIWHTDGTAAGTQILVDLVPGAGSASPAALTATAGDLFFVATQGASDTELWATDGTVPGTRRVADISPGATGSFPRQLTAFGALLVFEANDGVHGNEPWRSDGTAAGTFALADVMPGGATSMPQEFTLGDGGALVFFVAGDGTGPRSLWSTDGSVANTRRVHPTLGNVAHLAPAFGGVACAGNTPVTGASLWTSNGSSLGTAPVAGSPVPQFTSRYQNRVLFSASAAPVGRELFVSDGTPGGTGLVRDLHVDAQDSPLGNLTALGQSLFFSPMFAVGWVPWFSDGTANGTAELNFGLGNPIQPVSWRGEVWFTASTPATGSEMCRSNGTQVGTQVAFDLLPGSGTPSIQQLVPTTGPLFFTANTGGGRELFATDGTLAGTVAIDLRAVGAADPQQMVASGNRCVFSADDGVAGREPWISDGTLAGTVLLADLVPGGGSAASNPTAFAVVGPRVFFAATVPGVGRELCVTDGTPAGTMLFADLIPGASSSSPHDLVGGDSRLYFKAGVAGLGTKLFSSDGTPAGTGMVRDIGPVAGNVQIDDMVAVGDRLFCFADDRVHGRELWVSDGSAAGTHLVIDLLPGAGHGPVAGTLVRLPGTTQVVFASATAGDGLQWFVSDGTAAGTAMLGRMGSRPGSGSSILAHPTPVGDRLFFHGGIDDGAGQELWVVPLQNATAAAVVTYGDAQCPGAGGRSPRIGATGLPRLGNATFSIDVVGARPQAFAMLQLGFGRTSIPLGACRLLVLPPLAPGVLVGTGAFGIGRTPMPVPNATQLLGMRVNGQYGVFDAAGALFAAFALSDGIEFRVGP